MNIKTKYMSAVAIVVIATAFCGCTAGEDDEVIMLEKNIAVAEAAGNEAFAAENEAVTVKEETAQEEITVYVCGAVAKPGVYTLGPGTRVVDAVGAAGGPAYDAGFDYLNLAQELKDGQKVYIPTNAEIEEAIKAGSELYTAEVNITTNAPGISGGDNGQTAGNDGSDPGGSSGMVNINSADAQTLMTLPGIGQSKADKIIAYREANGGFGCIEDIMLVGGIKEGMFNKIKDRICVK